MDKVFYKILILYYLILPFCGVSQSYYLVKTINTKVDYLRIDIFGSLYLVNDNKLSRYDSIGNFIDEFSSNKFGQITSVDLSNPMRLLLFSKTNNQIIYLDNKLTQIGDAIDLSQFGIYNAGLVCNSMMGGLWLFDETENKLLRVDQNMNLIFKIDLRTSTGNNSTPIYFTEYQRKLYVLNQNYELFEIDNFGNQTFLMQLPEIKYFEVDNTQINYYFEFDFYKKSIDGKLIDKINIQLNGQINDVQIFENRLYILKNSCLFIHYNSSH